MERTGMKEVVCLHSPHGQTKPGGSDPEPHESESSVETLPGAQSFAERVLRRL